MMLAAEIVARLACAVGLVAAVVILGTAAITALASWIEANAGGWSR